MLIEKLPSERIHLYGGKPWTVNISGLVLYPIIDIKRISAI